MSNSRFNIEAEADGREFFRTHPDATGPEVDDAAPKFNPARRWFQNGFYFAKAESVQPVVVLTPVRQVCENTLVLCTCSEAIRTRTPHFMCDWCLDQMIARQQDAR